MNFPDDISERAMRNTTDEIERELMGLIRLAISRGDNDAALEASTDLTKYRRHFKFGGPA